MADNKKWLYDSLVGKGVNVGTYEQFDAALADDNNIDWIYNQATQRGINVGSKEQLAKAMRPETEPAPVGAEQPATQPAQSQREAFQAGIGKFVPETSQQPQQPQQKQQAAQDAQPQETQPEQPKDDYQQKVDSLRSAYSTEEAMPNITRWYKEDQTAAETAETDQATRDNVRHNIGLLSSDIDAAMADWQKNNRSALSVGPYYGAAAGMNATNDPTWRTLMSANNAINDSKKIISEADTNAANDTFGEWLKQTFSGGAVRGFGDKLFDVRTWDMGMSSGMEQDALSAAIDAWENNQPLTREQQLLLDAKAVNLATNAYFGSYVGRGYKAGGVTAEAIPFMIEMCINPASALGRTIQSRLARYAISKFGKKAAGSVANKLARTAARAAGDIVGAAGMAATTGIGGVVADTKARMTGDLQYDTDQSGDIVFSGTHSDYDSWAQAFKDAFLARSIENHSEMFGAYFAPILGVAGKGLRAGVNKIGLGKVVKAVDDIAASDLARMIGAFERSANWNGTIGEFAEEIVGGIENTLIVGDQTIADVFDRDNLIDTFLGVALLGGVMSGAKTLGYRGPKQQARRDLRRAERTMRYLLGDELASQFAASENEESDKMLVISMLDGTHTAEEVQAAMDYIKAKYRMDGIMTAQDKRLSEAGDPVQQEIEQSYENGYALEDTEELRDAKAMYAYQSERISTELGITEDIDAQFALANAATDEEREICLDYLNAKATYDGMIARVRDDVDGRIEAATEEIQQRTHKESGMIIPARTTDDRNVHIVAGNIVLREDGTIDRSKSDNDIVIRDENGKMEFWSIYNVLETDTPINAAEETEAVAHDIEQQYVKEQSDRIDGVLSYIPGDTYLYTAEDGTQQSVQVVQDMGDGTVVVTMGDGQQMQMSKADIQAGADRTQQLRLDEYVTTKAEARQQEYEQAEGHPHPYRINEAVTIMVDGQPVTGVVTEDETDDGVIVELDTADGPRVMLVSHQQLEEHAISTPAPEQTQGEFAPVDVEPAQQAEPLQAEEQPQQGDIMPMTAEGEPDFANVTPDRAKEWLYKESGFPEDVADQFVAAKRIEAAKAADKAAKATADNKKKQPKFGDAGIGTSLAKYNEAMAAWQDTQQQLEQAEGAARSQQDYWNTVQTPAEVSQIRQDAENSEVEDIDTQAQQQVETMLAPVTDLGYNEAEPATAEEFAALWLAEATSTRLSPDVRITITPESWDRHIGESRKKMVGIISTKGMSIEKAAEKLATAATESGYGYLINENDPTEAMDILIDVLRSGDSVGSIRRRAESIRDKRNSEELRAANRDADRFAYEQGYKDAEDMFDSLMEALASAKQRYYSKQLTIDGYKDEVQAILAKLEWQQPAAQSQPELETPAIDVQVEQARQEVETNPTEAQKEAGNYRKGHVVIDGYDITIENPRGSERSGTDAKGKEWRQTMNNDYGYIRRTEGVDGDHIDVFLSDHLDNWNGTVFVVDQVKGDGSFDEHKVMYGFDSEEEARQAYLSNYEEGWTGLGSITGVSKDDFRKWVDSSHRKTKPFADYKSVKKAQDGPAVDIPDNASGIFKNPQIQVERSRQLMNDLVEAYRSNDADAIQKAVDNLKAYVDEGYDMEGEYDEADDFYEGDDPEILARQYVIHLYHDRVLESDEDQEYIRTGIKTKKPASSWRDESFTRAMQELEKAEEAFRNSTEKNHGEAFVNLLSVKTVVENHISKLSDEELSDLKDYSEKHGKNSVVEKCKEEEKYRAMQESLKKDFASKISKQGEISGKHKEKKTPIESYAGKGDLRVYDNAAVYHDAEGYAVATNGYVIFASKEDFKKEHAGKIIAKGEEKEGKFPEWKAIVNKQNDKVINVDFPALLDFLAGVEERLKTQWRKEKEDGETKSSFTSWKEDRVIAIKTDEGAIAAFSYNYLTKFAEAAQIIGAKTINYHDAWTPWTIKNEKGAVAIMPLRIDKLDQAYMLDLQPQPEQKTGYKVGEQFNIIDDNNESTVCLIKNIDEQGNIELTIGHFGNSYKKTVTPEQLDEYREREKVKNIKHGLGIFISGHLDDEEDSFIQEMTGEEAYYLDRLIEDWAEKEVKGNVQVSEEAWDKMEDFVNQMRAKYPVNDKKESEQPSQPEQPQKGKATEKAASIEPQKAEVQAVQGIDDVGEKIEGAKKDLARKMSTKINLDADTFSKMFPKFDLRKSIEQGLEPRLAVLTKMMRSIAYSEYKKTNKKRGKRAALDVAKFFSSFAKTILENGSPDIDFTSQGIVLTDFGKEYIPLNARLFNAIYDRMGEGMFDIDIEDVYLYPIFEDENRKSFRRNPQTGEMEQYHPAYMARVGLHSEYFEKQDLDKAIKDTIDRLVESTDYKKTHPFKLSVYYTPGVKKSYYIGTKIKNKVVALTDKMSDKDAWKYLKEHEAELQAKAQSIKDGQKEGGSKTGNSNGGWKPELNLGGGRNRIGVDYRNGKNINAEELREAFNFRGVQFGNYVSQKDRQRFLNESYDALMDLADILGISPRAISLDGRLGFAVGARGGGKGSAHYEPIENVINLTKTKGAGTLAHEWFHALDFYFNRDKAGSPKSATSNMSEKMFPESVRREMREAFLGLMKTIENSDYYKRSAALDSSVRSSDYYKVPTELGARAFQYYVSRRLADQGRLNDFLSTYTLQDKWNGEPSNYPYPFGDEADIIDKHFDTLFQQIQERTDEQGNAILFSIFEDAPANSRKAEKKLKEDIASNKAVTDYMRSLYPDIKDDEELAGMIERRYSGRQGLLRMYDDLEAQMDNSTGYFEKAQVVDIFASLRDALVEFGENRMQDHLESRFEDASDILRVSSRLSVVRRMKEDGCSPEHISMVREVLASTEGTDRRIRGFYANGKVYLIYDDLRGLKDAESCYIHERQHMLTSLDGLAQQLIETGISRQEMDDVVASLSGNTYYSSLSDAALADEFISHVVEAAFREDTTPQAVLAAHGVTNYETIVLLNIIQDGNNGNLSQSGRFTHVAYAGTRDYRQDDGDEEAGARKVAEPRSRLDESGRAGTQETRFSIGDEDTYKDKDGKEIGYRQLELFGQAVQDDQAKASDTGRKPDNDIQRKEDELARPQHIGKLKEGEICLVERVFTKDGNFSFTASNKIESLDDVAYIFRQLEDSAVENAFMVYVTGGKPVVQHVGMGQLDATLFDTAAIAVMKRRLNPEKVFLVHNHPSGKLRPSIQDRQLWNAMYKEWGALLGPGIIIDQKSGKYSIFGSDYSEQNQRKANGNEVPVTVYKFDKQVFAPDYDFDNLVGIKNSEDVAAFISSHRLGERNKVNLLILSSSNNILGNVFLPYNDIKDKDKVVDDLRYYQNAFAGRSVMLYGTGVDIHDATLVKLHLGTSASLLDAISIDSTGSATSGSAMGLLEPVMPYNDTLDERTIEDSLTRFSIVEDPAEIARLEAAPKVSRYRAMALIDGKLYPPMSAFVDGELRDASPEMVWMTSDETDFEFTPEQITAMKALDAKAGKGTVVIIPGKLRYQKDSKTARTKGKLQFRLLKDNGEEVWAAYNPYFHTSTSAMNDQFATAYKRPNLVVVEVEIPEDETGHGYTAKYAKDPTGDTPWKSGVVNRALPKERQRIVTLARHAKITGKLSDVKVAGLIAGQLEGLDIEIPFNVVTPTLRDALVAKGVRIGAPEKGNAGKAAMKDYRRWKAASLRFSVTAEERKSYADAYENGDTEAARQMVREAAAKALPDTKVVDRKGNPLVVWHGTRGRFNVFRLNPDDIALHFGDKTTARTRVGRGKDAIMMPVYVNITNPIEFDEDLGAWDADYLAPRLAERSIITDEEAGSVLYTPQHHYRRGSREANAILRNMLLDKGYDGIIYNNFFESDGSKSYAAFSPAQVKSAQPFTIDIEGNLIPLDRRFDQGSRDIRFSVKDSDKLFAIAKERFGTTNDLREAGYILPDGSLLDFSGRHWTDDENEKSHLAGHRTVDHKDIQDLEFEKDGNTRTGIEITLPDFIRMGAVRIDGSGVVNLAVKPTEDQRYAIGRLVRSVDGNVDVDFGDGYQTDHYVQYSDAGYAKVLADIDRYFDHGIKPESDIRFSLSNKAEGVFISNAQKAVQGISQEKATPQQWLAMIDKSGGLKAAEDKWLGLSDWLKQSDKKTLTKQEVLDFIARNKIVIEEVGYFDGIEKALEEYLSSRYPSFPMAFTVDMDEFHNTPIVSINDIDEAVRLYNASNTSEQIVQEEDGYVSSAQKWIITKWAERLLFSPKEGIFDKETERRKYPIEQTRRRYTTEGLSNLREIALVVPSIEPYNQNDDVHFGDAGEGRAIAWARFGETTMKGKGDLYSRSIMNDIARRYGNFTMHNMSDEDAARLQFANYVYRGRKGNYTDYKDLHLKPYFDAERAERVYDLFEKMVKEDEAVQDKRVLVIDEIQSKRHQDGREKGYIDKAGLSKQLEIARSELERAKSESNAKISSISKETGITDKEELDYYILTKAPEKVRDEMFSLDAAVGKYSDEVDRLEGELENLTNGNSTKGVPSAPFEKNWHELAMKRMLRLAAEEGYDYVAWTKGEQQAERYGIGKVVDEITIWDAKPNETRSANIFLWHGEGNESVEYDADGLIINAEGSAMRQFKGENIRDVFGKELAIKMLNDETGTHIKGDNLRIGGEGMKAFYDKMLPSFMNKYGKKWGVKVQDITLPDVEKIGQTMWAVEVTPEMRESVLQGQPMFRIREQEPPRKTGVGYKVFFLKEGKLYPPMVANANGEATPVGMWLDAEAGEDAGVSKTGRRRVKAGGRGTQGGSGSLAYRPGWHLGEIPYALQFNRLNPETGEKELFPKQFVWAEVEYAADVDYQNEAMSYGQTPSGKFKHSLAGLPRIPVNGSYKYRTNPNPKTDPWIITGAMKVNRVLTPSEVDSIVKDAGREPQKREKGAITDQQVNILNKQLFKNAETQIDARRQKALDMGSRLNIKLRIVEDLSEIKDSDRSRETRKRRSYGWFEIGSNEIIIVLPNNRTVADVENTVLHEAVAHYGLRQLFGDDFNIFLDNVYNNAGDDVRKAIDDMKERKGMSHRVATEEYLASLAENTDFESAKNIGLWQKVKDWFMAMLRKAGIKLSRPLSDKELRYILWKSYQNLGDRGIIGIAQDIAMQDNLGVGNKNVLYSDRFAGGLKNADRVYDALDEHAQWSSGAAKLMDAIEKHFKGNIVSASSGAENAIKKGLVPVPDNKYFGEEREYHHIEFESEDGERFVEAVPFVKAENVEADYGIRFSESGDLLFRDGNEKDLTPRDRAVAREAYERAVSTGGFQFREAIQDSMLSLRRLYEAILGKGARIEDVPGFENAYLYENRMSSANKAQQHDHYLRYFRPLIAEIYNLVGSNAAKRQRLTDYLMAKHGLERNRVFAERDAEAATRNEVGPEPKMPLESDDIEILEEYEVRLAQWQDRFDMTLESKLPGFRERDYSGLTTLMQEDDVAAAEEKAQQFVDDFENEYDTEALWEKINLLTKSTLTKAYSGGLMSFDTLQNVSDMFDYYIPLRGFDETTSDEVYAYLESRRGTGGNTTIKHAAGRSSLADDPIATMAKMMDDAIRQANRNMQKQRFLNFVLSHPSDAASVSKLWLQYNETNGQWEPVFPDIRPSESADVVRLKAEAFEKKMRELAQKEPDKYRNGKDTVNIPFRVLPEFINEHQVIVRRGGEVSVITINGNPRAAQALNGLTNPDVGSGGIISSSLRAAKRINRKLSVAYTSANPDFVVSNFIRDALYSNTMAWVKEDPRYALAFHKNFGRFNPVTMNRLFHKWEKGTLSSDNETERLFYTFMTNGGETGYADLRSIKEHKRKIASEIKREGNGGMKFWAALRSSLDLIGRSVENVARFAAFVTSLQMGRTIDRAVWDAKEISVNFNKKGSGDKMLNAEGQTPLGKVGSAIGGAGGQLYVFWNAGVQGMTNYMKSFKGNPSAIAMSATMFALGSIIPFLSYIDGDDDDDKNSYYNLPEYIRRSNICFRVGDKWVTVTLPIEYRAMYGLGELAVGTILGKERYSDQELAYQIASQISQLMPLDMLEGGGGINPFIPSMLKPLAEAYWFNRSWTGLPVYKDTPFNKNDPEWTKAYKSADPALVDMTRWLNEVSGGNDVLLSKGKVNLNPAQIEYLLSGYLGGYFSFPEKLVNTAKQIVGDRDVNVRDWPLLNRVIKEGDERTEYRKLNEEYWKYRKIYEEMDRQSNNLLKSRADVDKFIKADERLSNDKNYVYFRIVENNKKLYKTIGKLLTEKNKNSDKERDAEIQEHLYPLMKALVYRLRLGDGYFDLSEDDLNAMDDSIFEWPELQEQYESLRSDYKRVKEQAEKYENAGTEPGKHLGSVGMAQKIDYLYNSDDYARYKAYDLYHEELDALEKAISEAKDDEERTELKAMKYGRIKEMLQNLDALDEKKK